MSGVAQSLRVEIRIHKMWGNTRSNYICASLCREFLSLTIRIYMANTFFALIVRLFPCLY